MNESYWFYIEPYVHISAKGNNALLYNTLNGKLREYDNPLIVKLIKKLDSKKNLLVIKLTGKELQNPVISKFVHEARGLYSGDLIKTSYSQKKPVQMRPQVKIQKDLEEVKEEAESFVGEGIMANLTEISFYLDNRCSQNCSFCKDAYKQFLVCTKKGGRNFKELEFEKIKQFVREAEGSSLFRINILAGDIFAYHEFAELAGFLNGIKKIKTYYTHYLSVIDRAEEISALRNDLSYLNVLVNFPVVPEKFANAAALCSGKGMNCEFAFVVQTEQEIETAQELCSRLKIKNFSFKPYFNQNNSAFFKENVFIKKEELWLAKPGLKEIYSRTRVNPMSFGKITVLSNGSIHANVNEKKIGVLGRDSLYDVVFKEMYDGSSWRKPRSKVAPCRSCIYCFLCPPLSNYEYALKRNNLCDIWM